ncbi:unnamed protein product [Paramecium primaurelia]|uniref:Uncharacterized protein n=1 Tax=Paramecium primaurelia TaxID=5886 RepID=A0A8S1PXR9_PARPR|nr:unnamed protein product [Paramecium primaurelia]
MQNLENQDKNAKELELIVWDQGNNGLLRQTILTVIQNQIDEVTCIKNGFILQFNKQDLIDDQKITKNLVKINHFKWKGKEGKEKQKIGKWEVYWKNKVQNIGGYYDNQGLKQGLWQEEYENFWDYAQIVYVGIYHNGIQRNRWDTIMNNNIIGGGNYDHNGKKTGKWVELHLNYFKQNYAYCDATYEGEYLEGRKYGYWQTFLSKKIIGGGFYNQDGQKDGFWIELNDNFSLMVYKQECGKLQQFMTENKYICKIQKIVKWGRFFQ